MGVDFIFNQSNLEERSGDPVGIMATLGVGKGTCIEIHSRIGSTRIVSFRYRGGSN